MKRITRILVSIVCLFLLPVGVASSQEKDAKGCQDHPLISRMNSYYIDSCESNFNSFEFFLPEGAKTLEGERTKIEYYLRKGSPQSSYLQIRRNYSNAVKNIGGAVLLDDGRRGIFKLTKGGKETWIAIEAFNDGRSYELVILEMAPMMQEVTADAMYSALSKDGFMALYINFDTGKSDIKPESLAIIGQIAALLQAHPELKVSIEGHTDNVGTPQNNKVLSTQRAKSVMNAVVQKGIAATRLTALGWGQEKPIADNRSEEGMAKNRRVEIVKNATAGEIGKEDRFIAYDNGTVLDTSTNLMWAAKDNGSNIKWANAKSYCKNYRGGGYTDWRMPTQDELAGLYDSKTKRIKVTGYWVWSSEMRGSEAAVFSFTDGRRDWGPQSYDVGDRALPVRSGK